MWQTLTAALLIHCAVLTNKGLLKTLPPEMHACILQEYESIQMIIQNALEYMNNNETTLT